MKTHYRFWPWLLTEWSRAGLLMAFVLLALAPLIDLGFNRLIVLLYLQLPVYMAHQYEEHAHGAFKQFANAILGNGREVLTDLGIFWINIGLVWIVDLIALYLALFWDPFAGLVGVYLMLVNGIAHVAGALLLRKPNPGVWTSLLLFLPLCAATLWVYTTQTGASPLLHLAGIGLGIGLHMPIGIYAMFRRRQLAAHG